MKRLFPVLLLFFVIVHFSSCEKDDICVEGDTPLLVVGFYNFLDTAAFKRVTNLRIKALDNDSILDSSVDFGFNDRGNSPDSITIPLRISEPSTSFQFITRSADDDEGNESGSIDTLTFTYNVNEKFVSRACGFVANFIALDTVRNVFDDDWIKQITIQEPNVELSNTIHVKIFH